MRLPNGYGSVSKLSGNRRKPWRVRKTIGWTDEGKQQSITVGYYETQAKAMKALAEYNENPYSISDDATFADIYEKWSDEKFESISDSNVKGYKASYSHCQILYDMKFGEIRKNHLQAVIDKSGKNYPTLRKIKVLFNQLFKYAMENDICQKDYSQYVDIVKHKDKSNKDTHIPFTESEITVVWENVERNEYLQIVLMLLYSGVRVTELLDLKKENINLAERYFDVIESKTDAGIRKVPISEKVYPYYLYWMQKTDNKYLLTTPDDKHLTYRNFRDSYWDPLIKELGMTHLPHDTRHTTISMLAKAEVNQTIIKRIVGHSGAMSLTERVYTHFDIKQLVEAINKI